MNIITNDFYPMMRLKPYFADTFYTADEMTEQFRFKGIYTTKIEGSTLIDTTYFDFIKCADVTSELKDKYQALLAPEIAAVVDNECFCPNIDDEFLRNLELFGNFQNQEYKILRIIIYPCINEGSVVCATPNLEDHFEMFFMSVKHSFDPYNVENPFEIKIDMEQSFPFKRKNFIKRIYRFEKFELYDDGLNLKSIFLKSRHNDVTTIQSNTILRVIDANSHICNVGEIESGDCIPYLQLNLESSKRLNNVVRIHPTFIGTAGEVGGTCEIVVFCFAIMYMVFFSGRNRRAEERDIWHLTEADKENYHLLTNHEITEEEEEEIRKVVVCKGKDGSKISKIVSLVDLLIMRVFKPRERENLNLAIYDPSILTEDESNKMNLRNLMEIREKRGMISHRSRMNKGDYEQGNEIRKIRMLKHRLVNRKSQMSDTFSRQTEPKKRKFRHIRVGQAPSRYSTIDNRSRGGDDHSPQPTSQITEFGHEEMTPLSRRRPRYKDDFNYSNSI